MMIGAGITRSDPTFTSNPVSEIQDARARSSSGLELGFLYYKDIGKNIAVRPVLNMNFHSTSIAFYRRNPVGGQMITETVEIDEVTFGLITPLVLRLSSKNISPYIMAGPSFHWSLGQDDTSALKLPVKSFSFMGNAGFGVDIGFNKEGFILSPEIKYAHGFSELKENSSSIYSNALSSLKRIFFTLTFYLRVTK